MQTKDQDTKKSFVRWFRRFYWSLGGIEQHLELNADGDFKVNATALAYEAYLAGIRKGKDTPSPKIAKALQQGVEAMQELTDAADGIGGSAGWDQLDASFTKLREAVKVQNKIIEQKETK